MNDFLSSNRRTTQAILDENTPFFAIWNPESSLPPSVIYTDEEHAWTVAERLAAKHPDQRFYVLQSGGHAVTSRPVVRKRVKS